MYKKMMFLIGTAVILSLALAACGGGANTEPTPVPTIPPAKEETAPEPTSAPAQEEVSQPTGDVAATLATALEAANEGNWDKVETELNEALDATSDAEQKAAIEELLDDLGKQDYEEVIADLEGMVGGAPSGDAAMAKLDKALDYANEENWDKVDEELNEALDLSTDAEQKAAIEELLDDLGKQDYEEVVADLEGMVNGTAAADPVMAKLDKALDYANEANWDKVNEELNEALDLSTDAEQKAAIEELLDDVAAGKYDEVVEDLENLLQ